MPYLQWVVIGLGSLSALALVVMFAVTAVRQKAIGKFDDLRKELDQFTQSFVPGDLVRGPQRFRHGRAQAQLQTAEHHYAMGKKELVENTRFWKALNHFWDAESHLRDARQEVDRARVEAS